MSLVDTRDIEERIAARLDTNVASSMSLSTNKTGGLAFTSMTEVMEFAKAMAIANIGVRKHLRGNVGACLAVTVQAIEWEMSPFAVANKSYLVNDQIAYEAQLINAVVLKRAPIIGRFRIDYRGDEATRQCRVSARLRNFDGRVNEDGVVEIVDYESPLFSRINPKNSPLWKTDPDQQLFYYSSRALCRRHFPDVLLGVYDVDELIADNIAPQRGGPRNVTPARSLDERLDALASGGSLTHDAETGEIETEDNTNSAALPPTGVSESADEPRHAAGGGSAGSFSGDPAPFSSEPEVTPSARQGRSRSEKRAETANSDPRGDEAPAEERPAPTRPAAPAKVTFLKDVDPPRQDPPAQARKADPEPPRQPDPPKAQAAPRGPKKGEDPSLDAATLLDLETEAERKAAESFEAFDEFEQGLNDYEFSLMEPKLGALRRKAKNGSGR